MAGQKRNDRAPRRLQLPASAAESPSRRSGVAANARQPRARIHDGSAIGSRRPPRARLFRLLSSSADCEHCRPIPVAVQSDWPLSQESAPTCAGLAEFVAAFGRHIQRIYRRVPLRFLGLRYKSVCILTVPAHKAPLVPFATRLGGFELLPTRVELLDLSTSRVECRDQGRHLGGTLLVN